MSRWSLGGERGIGKLLRLQGVEVAGEKRHERLVRFIGGGELEQDDGRRTLLVAVLAGGNDVVVADIDGQLRVIDDVVRERGRCDGIGGTIELESLAGDLGESIRGILVRVFVREVEALAVDEEFHDVTIQAGLGCREYAVLIFANKNVLNPARRIPWIRIFVLASSSRGHLYFEGKVYFQCLSSIIIWNFVTLRRTL